MEQIEALQILAEQLSCETKRQESMSKHTTFKIGGPADLYAAVPNQQALQILLQEANRLEIPFLLLGNGSNLLVGDSGFRGLVVSLTGEFRKAELQGEDTILCGAGTSLSALCSFALKNSLAGAEFLWGIPGTVGGAVLMNAGAYGGEMKDILLSSCHLTMDGKFGSLQGMALKLSYRHSAYMENGAVILKAALGLRKGNSDKISSIMDDLMGRRKSKQPLELPSAGSVFKRPQGYFAGALIEQCGLKGASVGGAMVSPKHAGFIVNMGGATCRDVLSLIEKIQETVLRKTGVALECEVKTVGT